MIEPQKSVAASTLRGRIVEWNPAKGFGFVDDGKQRVFLHRRDFRQWHQAPAVGDAVTYTIGNDAHGRKCAKDAELVNSRPSLVKPSADRRRFGVGALLVLTGLLVAPLWAAMKAPDWMDWRWAAGWSAAMSLLTYVVYAFDKRQAQEQGWRTAEGTLLFCDLTGGWPGGFVAQRRLRHKSAKASFQIGFWMIVALYEYVAIDSLLGWRMTGQLWRWLGG